MTTSARALAEAAERALLELHAPAGDTEHAAATQRSRLATAARTAAPVVAARLAAARGARAGFADALDALRDALLPLVQHAPHASVCEAAAASLALRVLCEACELPIPALALVLEVEDARHERARLERRVADLGEMLARAQQPAAGAAAAAAALGAPLSARRLAPIDVAAATPPIVPPLVVPVPHAPPPSVDGPPVASASGPSPRSARPPRPRAHSVSWATSGGADAAASSAALGELASLRARVERKSRRLAALSRDKSLCAAQLADERIELARIQQQLTQRRDELRDVLDELRDAETTLQQQRRLLDAMKAERSRLVDALTTDT